MSRQVRVPKGEQNSTSGGESRISCMTLTDLHSVELCQQHL